MSTGRIHLFPAALLFLLLFPAAAPFPVAVVSVVTEKTGKRVFSLFPLSFWTYPVFLALLILSSLFSLQEVLPPEEELIEFPEVDVVLEPSGYILPESLSMNKRGWLIPSWVPGIGKEDEFPVEEPREGEGSEEDGPSLRERRSWMVETDSYALKPLIESYNRHHSATHPYRGHVGIFGYPGLRMSPYRKKFSTF